MMIALHLRFSSLVALFALTCFFSTTALAQTLHLPPHEKIVLKNGLTLLLLEKPGVPMIDVFAIVKTGSASDPAGQSGVASATAGLLRKGTAKRTAQQFAADFDFIGGGYQAEAGSDYSVVAAEFLAKDMDHGFELVFDPLMHPAFPQAEVDKFLAQSLDGVRAAKEDPLSVIQVYFDAYLYGTHPYGRYPVGDEISLKRIQREAIVKFYDANYAPGNTIVAIAGDFPAAELRAKAIAMLESWPARAVKSAAIPTPVSVKGKRLLLVNKPDATQTYFAIGNVGVAKNDPDRVAIRLVNAIFGGTFTSQLNQALRIESGYTYGAESIFDAEKVAGPFVISSYTKNETTAPAIDLALQVLDTLHKNGVTREQLDSARNYIKGQYPPNIETPSQLAQVIATHEFYGLGDDEVNQLEARLDAVTPEMAGEVIRKHFPLENLVFTLIGDAKAISPAVKHYAATQDAREITDPGYWPPSSQ
jgi:zinc protease